MRTAQPADSVVRGRRRSPTPLKDTRCPNHEPTELSRQSPSPQRSRDRSCLLGDEAADDRHGRVDVGLSRLKNVPVAGAIGIFGLIFALRLQLRQREYRAPVYWFAVMMVAIFGTMAADGVHDGASLPYAVTTVGYAALTAAVFIAWFRSEGTLSIHSINTRRRESYYWAAVLSTFALGTAAGDLTAISLNLGFFDSVLLFGAIILIPAVGWSRLKMNPIVAFWFAYIVTRPLGASFADWFAKPPNITGLGAGDGLVSALALAVFVALVSYVTLTRSDVQEDSHFALDGQETPFAHPHAEILGESAIQTVRADL